jgi:predicted HTH domain antitoxin
MATVTIQVPDDQLCDLGNSAEEAGQTLRLAAAYHLCSRGQMSTSKAAHLAGLTYAEFLQAAVRDKVDLYHYDIAEIQEEIVRPLQPGLDIEAVRQGIARAQSGSS